MVMQINKDKKGHMVLRSVHWKLGRCTEAYCAMRKYVRKSESQILLGTHLMHTVNMHDTSSNFLAFHLFYAKIEVEQPRLSVQRLVQLFDI